jgi:hypothetical protein
MKLNTYCPWKEHLYELEEEMGCQGEVLYCLYEVRAVLPARTRIHAAPHPARSGEHGNGLAVSLF